MNIWKILEIEATKDENVIKNAYRTKLARTNPEDDPEGFKKLREAYEEAVRLIYESDEEIDDEPKTEVDFWLVKVSEIYNDWKRRINIDEWKTILEDEVCIALDTSDEATEKLLVFLMTNYNLPYEVWGEINKTFDYVNLKLEIREKFPEGFINFVCNQINYRGFIDYKDIIGEDDAPYDETINYYYGLKRSLDENQNEEIEEAVNAILDSGIEHPYFTTDILRYALKYRENNQEYILDLIKKAESYEENFYVYAYLCEAYMFLGDIEKAGYYINRSRELNSEFINGALVHIRYLMAKGDYSEAKEKSADFLEEHGNHPEGLRYMRESNDILMKDFRQKADAGDADAFLDLGWCMFQNEMFKETIEMLDEYTPDEEHYFDYCNLYGRCALAGSMFEKAIDYLVKWNKLITKLVDDGTEKYKKRIRRLAYSYYSVACCATMLGGKHKCKGNFVKKVSMYKMAEFYMKKAIECEKDLRELYHYKERLAYLYAEMDCPRDAIEICNAILKEEPQYYPAYCIRQLAYYDLRNGQGVIDDFYNAIELYPYNPEVYVYATKAFINYEQYSDAKNILDRADENKVSSLLLDVLKSVVSRNIEGNSEESLIKALESLDRLEGNIASYVEEGTSDEDIAELYFNRMRVYIVQNKYECALNEIEKALEYNRYPFNYVWYQAELLTRTDRPYDAYDVYMKEVKEGREDAEVYFNLGKIMVKLSMNAEDIIKILKKGLDIEPEHYALNDLIAEQYIEKYRRYGRKEDYKIAIEYENRQIDINPGAYVLVNRGLMYLDNGEFDNAIKDFEKAIEFEPDDLYAYNNIGYAYKRQKEYEKAVEIYKKALELEVEDSKEIIHRNLYIAYLLLGKYGEAYDEVSLMVKEYYGGQAGFDMFTEIYRHSGENKKCLEVQEIFAESVENEEERYKVMAETAILMEDKKLAKKYIKLLGKVSKNGQRSYNKRLAEYYVLIKEDKQKALRYFIEAAKNASDINPHIHAARMSYKLGVDPKPHVDEVYKIIDDVWNTREDFLDYVIDGKLNNFNMALIKLYMGDIEGAIECMNRMDKLPMCANCHYSDCYERKYLEAIIEEHEGNRIKALELLKEALVINPSDLEVIEEIKDLR